MPKPTRPTGMTPPGRSADGEDRGGRAAIAESFFLGTRNQSIGLPPIWETIFHEGVRGNHILFNDADVKRFIGESEVGTPACPSASFDSVEDAAFRVVEADSLTAMKAVVDLLDMEARRALFRLYRHCLRAFTFFAKDGMN